MYLCNSELLCVLNRLGKIIAGWVEELACHQKTSTYHSWFSRSGVQW